MKIVVTGAHGKVGRATVQALFAAGHEVMGIDLTNPGFERKDAGTPTYRKADITNAGDAFAMVAGFDAVVHVAAIPDPTGHPAHVVFQNNIMATFNMIEAAIRFKVKRFVYISSETIPGFSFPDRPFLPTFAPIDETHPIAPQDPYALSKWFGELLMDSAVARTDIDIISLRPTWVQFEGNYENNLGPQIRDDKPLSPNLWSYIDLYDLADAVVLATESKIKGHEIFYIASPDNVGGRDFAAMLKKHYGDKIELRPVDRVDASGISSKKAQTMLGWKPKRSWRDYLDSNGEAIK